MLRTKYHSSFTAVSNYYTLISEFEAGFIRLLDKLTNGSRIEVDVTGEKVT